METDLAVVILAAGMGTRMNSKKQKILHAVGGAPMVMHAVDAARQVSSHPPVLVVGPIGGDRVRRLVGPQAEYVVQEEQLGTGHAAMTASDLLHGRAKQVVVTYADMPLLRAETLQQLAEKQAQTGAAVVMLSLMGDPESSFGRVVRGDNDQVMEIVEVAEAEQRANTAELLAIREQNAGVYCFDADWLWVHIDELPLRKARSGHEYYLTDMIGLAVTQGRAVTAIVAEDAGECLGAGTRMELTAVEQAFRHRANDKWLQEGVTLVNPEQVYIDQAVRIGQDTIIWPNTFIQGHTVIGRDCVIGPNAILRNARIGDGVTVEQAVVEDTAVEEGEIVRPFTHLTADE